jgi:hypothetical protein
MKAFRMAAAYSRGIQDSFVGPSKPEDKVYDNI